MTFTLVHAPVSVKETYIRPYRKLAVQILYAKTKKYKVFHDQSWKNTQFS